MTNRTRTGMVVLALAQGLAGCSPTAPSLLPRAGVPPTPTAIQLQGSVRDQVRPLAGALVSAVSGPEAAAVTDATGRFSITGPGVERFAGTDTFRADKDGYASGLRSLASGLAFVLEPLPPAVNIGGEYTLTITADSACTDLPAEVRTRTYAARFSGGGGAVALGSVSGATFLRGQTEIDGYIRGHTVEFTTDVHGPGWIVEEVAPNTYLAIRGSSLAPVTTPVSTISGPFEGLIEYCAASSPMGSIYGCSASRARAPCTSKNHQLILRRR